MATKKNSGNRGRSASDKKKKEEAAAQELEASKSGRIQDGFEPESANNSFGPSEGSASAGKGGSGSVSAGTYKVDPASNRFSSSSSYGEQRGMDVSVGNSAGVSVGNSSATQFSTSNSSGRSAQSTSESREAAARAPLQVGQTQHEDSMSSGRDGTAHIKSTATTGEPDGSVSTVYSETMRATGKDGVTRSTTTSVGDDGIAHIEQKEEQSVTGDDGVTRSTVTRAIDGGEPKTVHSESMRVTGEDGVTRDVVRSAGDDGVVHTHQTESQSSVSNSAGNSSSSTSNSAGGTSSSTTSASLTFEDMLSAERSENRQVGEALAAMQGNGLTESELRSLAAQGDQTSAESTAAARVLAELDKAPAENTSANRMSAALSSSIRENESAAQALGEAPINFEERLSNQLSENKQVGEALEALQSRGLTESELRSLATREDQTTAEATATALVLEGIDKAPADRTPEARLSQALDNSIGENAGNTPGLEQMLAAKQAEAAKADEFSSGVSENESSQGTNVAGGTSATMSGKSMGDSSSQEIVDGIPVASSHTKVDGATGDVHQTSARVDSLPDLVAENPEYAAALATKLEHVVQETQALGNALEARAAGEPLTPAETAKVEAFLQETKMVFPDSDEKAIVDIATNAVQQSLAEAKEVGQTLDALSRGEPVSKDELAKATGTVLEMMQSEPALGLADYDKPATTEAGADAFNAMTQAFNSMTQAGGNSVSVSGKSRGDFSTSEIVDGIQVASSHTRTDSAPGDVYQTSARLDSLPDLVAENPEYVAALSSRLDQSVQEAQALGNALQSYAAGEPLSAADSAKVETFLQGAKEVYPGGDEKALAEFASAAMQQSITEVKEVGQTLDSLSKGEPVSQEALAKATSVVQDVMQSEPDLGRSSSEASASAASGATARMDEAPEVASIRELLGDAAMGRSNEELKSALKEGTAEQAQDLGVTREDVAAAVQELRAEAVKEGRDPAQVDEAVALEALVSRETALSSEAEKESAPDAALVADKVQRELQARLDVEAGSEHEAAEAEMSRME